MNTLIEAIGPLAFWILALGVAPAVLMLAGFAVLKIAVGRHVRATQQISGRQHHRR